MRKRAIVAAVLVAAAALGCYLWSQRLAAEIKLAYIYAYPVYEVEMARFKALKAPDAAGRQAVNGLVHRRALADPAQRLITTPNNDTLYSSGLLDLRGGPLRFDLPAFGKRYYSFTFYDEYTNAFDIVGTRTAGGDAQSFVLVGPAWDGPLPAGLRVVHSPTPQVWLLLRTLIDGPEDLAAVHRLQDGIKVQALGHGAIPDDLVDPAKDDGQAFVAVVNHALALNPPPAADAPVLALIGKAGIGPRAVTLTPELLDAWEHLYPAEKTSLVSLLNKPKALFPGLIQGWSYPPHIGSYGTSYLLRAAVALRGLLALPQEEAIYTEAREDAKGRPLDGARRYRLHLPAGAPPVGAFWSLTAYQVFDDGGLYFTENPIQRYAIGDRTRGLKRNADGSLDLLIQAAKPDGEGAANWLPLPKEHPALFFRAYLPQGGLLDGSFHYPPLEPLD